jgi:hypothetical protein
MTNPKVTDSLFENFTLKFFTLISTFFLINITWINGLLTHLITIIFLESSIKLEVSNTHRILSLNIQIIISVISIIGLIYLTISIFRLYFHYFKDGFEESTNDLYDLLLKVLFPKRVCFLFFILLSMFTIVTLFVSIVFYNTLYTPDKEMYHRAPINTQYSRNSLLDQHRNQMKSNPNTFFRNSRSYDGIKDYNNPFDVREGQNQNNKYLTGYIQKQTDIQLLPWDLLTLNNEEYWTLKVTFIKFIFFIASTILFLVLLYIKSLCFSHNFNQKEDDYLDMN